MDRVQRAERGLIERAGGREQVAIERQHGEGVEQLACALQQDGERQPRVVRSGAMDRARDLGEYKLTAEQVGVGHELAQRRALGLPLQQLDSADASR